MFASDPLITGLTLSGGDPMEQAAECAQLAALARAKGRNIWTYTGYTYEQLLAEGDPDKLALLEQTDVLVDGPFVLSLRSLDLLYCGSKNQRIIDMNKTRREGSIVLWQPPEW